MTWASSSFSPLAGVDGPGIFLADEGLDDGVTDLAIVQVGLETPIGNISVILDAIRFAGQQNVNVLFIADTYESHSMV